MDSSHRSPCHCRPALAFFRINRTSEGIYKGIRLASLSLSLSKIEKPLDGRNVCRRELKKMRTDILYYSRHVFFLFGIYLNAYFRREKEF